MPMPTPLPLSNTQFITSLYNSATQDYDLVYPCPAHELRNPSLSLNLMPPKSVSLYSPLDPLDEDDDDDLPPLVEAPSALVDPGDEHESSAATVDQDATRRIGEGAGGVAGPVGGNDGNIQYTFESTITPATFGAISSPVLASHSPIQRVHASDGTIDPRTGTSRLTSYPVFSAAQPPPLNAQSRSVHHARTGIESGGDRSGFGARIEPPSPSNADAGSTPSPAPSPSFGADSTTTTTSPPPLSLTLDEQREPSSGLSRTGAHGQGQGGGRKRPPSYIPRPPNAFILFRASFVRSQRFESPSPSSIGSTGVTTGGVSALGQGSVVTIAPTSPSGGKRGNKASGFGGIGHGQRRVVPIAPAPPSGGNNASGFGGIGHGGTTAPTSSTSLSKLAGQIWRSMPPDQRAVWENRARVAQAEHRAKYPDWRFRPENASGTGVGTAPDNTFWSGGGTTMGSVLWGGGETGGGEDRGGAAAAGKLRRGGTNKGGGGGDRSRKKKEKDRDRDKEREASKGKERTGVGTNTDSSSHPSSSAKTKRGRWGSARASASTSALGVPSWALPALSLVGDNVANPGANSSTGATATVEGGKASTEPRNTKEASEGGLSNATPTSLPDTRQHRMGIPNVLPAGSISPRTGVGAGSFGYGQMYGYERGLDFEHSPPPPSPEVSSPLSAMSPTYTGHGSPPFMPFHHPTQHHSQTQAREHMPGAIAPPLTLPTHHEHAEQMVSQAPFLSPVTQPSFYERAREQQDNIDVERDVGMDITMDTDTSGSVSMPSGSATTSTLTSVYSTGGTVPLPTRLSSYSSLIGWAGTASPFGPGSETDASLGAVFDSSFFTGGGTGADASTFSPHTFAYMPYPHADSGEWYGYDFGGGGLNIENPTGEGTSGMIGSVGASLDTDAIAFGPGPNFTPTPSPTEGPSDAVQRSQPFAPQDNSSQSQSQSALSPPLSHRTPSTRSHYDTLFSVPGVFQSPSSSGGEFVPIPDYSGGVSGVHGSPGPGVVASSGNGNDDSGQMEEELREQVKIILDVILRGRMSEGAESGTTHLDDGGT